MSDREFFDEIAARYFALPAATRWQELCRFLDRVRASMSQSTEWQCSMMLTRLADAIGHALVARDPTARAHADALIERYPLPSPEQYADEFAALFPGGPPERLN